MKGILFDMDGVLVDSGPLHLRAWKMLAEGEGVALTDDFFKETFGMKNDSILRLIFGDDLEETRIQELGDEKERLYREIAEEELKAAPGALELCKELEEAGISMALASSGPRENVEQTLRLTGLADHIRTFVCAGDVEKGKPDPQVFLLAAEKLGVAPKDCIVVEDAPVGIEAALRAKMKVVALCTSHEAQELMGSHQIVPLLKELTLPVLESLFAFDLEGGER